MFCKMLFSSCFNFTSIVLFIENINVYYLTIKGLTLSVPIALLAIALSTHITV